MSERLLSEILRERFAGRAAPERPAGYDDLRQAASFFLLVDRDETHAFLVKKKETPGYTWSGQVGMVGGMIEDEDDDDLAAALREFEEELELPASSLEVFGDLGYFPSTVADALLHVFVARWNGEGEPVPDPAEIDYLIEVPLSVLREIHRKEKLPGTHPDPEGRGPFYPIELPSAGGSRRTSSRESKARRREADSDEPLSLRRSRASGTPSAFRPWSPGAGPQVPSRKRRRRGGLVARDLDPQQKDSENRRLVVWGVTARAAHSLLELVGY